MNNNDHNFDEDLEHMDLSFKKLSCQVLSMVENRVRKAFSNCGSPPVSLSPIEIQDNNNYHPINGPNFTKTARINHNNNNSTVELSSSPILTTGNDELPIYTLNEVSYHDSRDDCWVIIYDRVYDITHFVIEHPGGEEVLLEYAGRDCTLPFRGVGHSKFAEMALEPYIIGILPERERLWTRFLDIRVERR